MAITQPIVSWYKPTNNDTDQVTLWDIGVVDASQTSPDFTFLIWNNRKGTQDVPDMQNAYITTKDKTGGNTGELVTQQWIWVKVEGVDTTFNPIGWDTMNNAPVQRPIKAVGSTTNANGTFTPNEPPHTTTSGTVSILGVANDGSLTNAAGNYAKVTLHARVPGTASAGLVEFLLRVTYQYV